MVSLTLKRHNSFQNQSNRKATHNFAARPSIFKLQQELLKFIASAWVRAPQNWPGHKFFKGALTKIWKSVNTFAFISKLYVEDFTLRHLFLFDICKGEICGKFVYKHSENRTC